MYNPLRVFSVDIVYKFKPIIPTQISNLTVILTDGQTSGQTDRVNDKNNRLLARRGDQ